MLLGYLTEKFYIAFSVKHTFKNGIDLEIVQENYALQVKFTHKNSVNYINADDVLSIAMSKGKIVYNGVESEFSFEDDEIKYLLPLLDVLNKKCSQNKNKLLDAMKEKNTEYVSKETKQSVNPWLAGGIGLLLGGMVFGD